MDADGRLWRLREVLADEHEQRQDVPGTQGPRPRTQVLLQPCNIDLDPGGSYRVDGTT